MKVLVIVSVEVNIILGVLYFREVITKEIPKESHG